VRRLFEICDLAELFEADVPGSLSAVYRLTEEVG
jgi:hypothetical protein